MRPFLLSAVLFAACTGSLQVTPAPAEVPAMTVVLGAPIERPRPTRTTPGRWSNPSALWLQSGEVTVLDGALVKQRSGTTFSTLSMSDAPGTVKAVTRRGAGVLLAASGGFFHDGPGTLLRAPVSDDFAMETLRFVDAVDTAIWVTTANEAVRLLEGRRESVRITDPLESGEVQVLARRTVSAAVLVKGASLYAVDLEAKTVTTLARGVGTVTAIDHRGEVVLLGTSEGLLEVSADDDGVDEIG